MQCPVATNRWSSAAADLVTSVALATLGVLLIWLVYLAPRAATLSLATPDAILPRTDFYDLEHFADGGTFRWSDGDSTLAPPNPGGVVQLSLRLVGGPQGATPVTLRSDTLHVSFEVEPERRVYRMVLPGSFGDRLTLTLASPRVEQRDRDLGIMVGDLTLYGAGPVPRRLMLAMLLASPLLYILMRRALWRRRRSAIAVAGLQAGVAFWQLSGGWMYGLTAQVLLLASLGGIAALIMDVGAARGWFPGGRLLPRTSRAARVSRAQLALMCCSLIAIALLARLPWLAAHDPVGDLELAARRMYYLQRDGLAGAFIYDGDYLPLRLYVLWAAGALVKALGASFFAPLPPATLAIVKLPQLLADLGLITVIALQSRRTGDVWWAALVALLYALLPPIWMNVAWWGQVDALLLLALVGSVVLLERAEGRWSWLCWALAALIKAQAVVLLPLLAVATLRCYRLRGLLAGMGIAGALAAAACAPLLLAGQGFGLLQAYLGSVGRFPRVQYGAYNLWFLALSGVPAEDQAQLLGLVSYRAVGFALLGGVALIACAAVWWRADLLGWLRAAALLALGFFVLPTQIHERYLFIALPFLALAAAHDRRLLPLLLVLGATAAINIVGILNGFWPDATAWVGQTPLPMLTAGFNVAALVILLALVVSGDQGSGIGDRASGARRGGEWETRS